MNIRSQATKLLIFLKHKMWEISALSMLSRCQKYAQNWWGVTFTKSHTIAPTRASLIPPFLPVCHQWGPNTLICMVCTIKKCPWFKERLPCSFQPWKTLLACIPQHQENHLFLLISFFPPQFSIILPRIHGGICRPVTQHGPFSLKYVCYDLIW